METTTKEIIAVLNNLLEINNDRKEGYRLAADETTEADLKIIFTEFADISESFKLQLALEIQKLGGIPLEGTRTTGKLYRIWMDIKAALTNKDRKAILNSCEFGEVAALNSYEEALKNNDIDSELFQLINGQYAKVKSDHKKIKKFRDAVILKQ